MINLRKKSLTWRIILSSISIAIIPFIFVCIIILFSGRALLKSTIQEYSRLNLDSMGRSVEDLFYKADTISSYIMISDSFQAFCKSNPADTPKETLSQYSEASRNEFLFFPYSDLNNYSITVDTNYHTSLNVGTHKIEATEEERAEAARLLGKKLWSVIDERFCHVVTALRLFREPGNPQNELGYIRVSFDVSALTEILSRSQGFNDTAFFLVDNDGLCLASNDLGAGYRPSLEKFLEKNPVSAYSTYGSRAVIEGDSCYLLSYPIESSGWWLVSMLPNYSYHLEPFQPLIIITLSGIIVLGILSLSLSFILSKILRTPLQEVCKKMEDVAHADFTTRIQVPEHSDDEISKLVYHFNDMVEKIETLYDDITAKQMALKDAQIAEMQSRLHPHFLYNTLNTIHWLACLNNLPDIATMTNSLSSMFRISFSSGFLTTTPLSTEIEQLNHYINIQSIRFQGSIRFQVSIDEHLSSVLVIPLALEPIVENAVTHGLSSIGSGTVGIKIYARDGDIFYEIQDDGVGADPAYIERLLTTPPQTPKGYALYNINKRIKLIYGGSYGIRYYHLEKGGSMFLVHMSAAEKDPKEKAEEEEHVSPVNC